jgi:hypothetical protein
MCSSQAVSEGTIICGIFGAIAPAGKQVNLGIIRALTWANRERGTDSCGFFDSSGKMTKRAGDPSKVLLDDKVQTWLKASRESAWFIAGHTRFATRGKVNRRNSHPFRYGRIIGSHNGMCDAPDKFQVDSEYLFYALNKARGDYNKALGEVGGYWGLSWYDGEDFYLMSHNGELAVVEIDGVWYYSSSWKHLDACTGGNCHTLGEGEVWKFNANGLVGSSNVEGSDVKAFVSTGTKWGYYSVSGRFGGTTYYPSRRQVSGTSGSGAAKGWWNNNDGTAGNGSGSGTLRDYDQDWCDAWTSYCDDDSGGGTDEETGNGSIHGLTDEEFEESRYAG